MGGEAGGNQRHEEIDLENSDAPESQPWERPFVPKKFCSSPSPSCQCSFDSDSSLAFFSLTITLTFAVAPPSLCVCSIRICRGAVTRRSLGNAYVSQVTANVSSTRCLMSSSSPAASCGLSVTLPSVRQGLFLFRFLFWLCRACILEGVDYRWPNVVCTVQGTVV